MTKLDICAPDLQLHQVAISTIVSLPCHINLSLVAMLEIVIGLWKDIISQLPSAMGSFVPSI